MIRRSVMTALYLFVAAGALADSLPDKRIAFSSRPQRELLDYCCATNITCAIEIDTQQMPEAVANASVSLAYTAGISSQVFRQIMRRYSGHSWRYESGILTVTPNRKVQGNPIDIPLGSVDFRNERMENMLAKIGPRAKLSPAGFVTRSSRRPAQKLVSYSAPNPTVRELFTSLVKQYGRSAWSIRHEYSAISGRYSIVNIITYDNNTCSLPPQ